MTFIPVDRRIEHVDTDAAGVVHFSRYFSLLETAVLENLDRLGVGLSALQETGRALVVAESRMRYHASARFLDQVRVEAAVSHLGAASFRMSGTVSGPHGPLTTGTVVFAVTDAEGAPAGLPDRLATALKELLP